jgi:hypothetical protein
MTDINWNDPIQQLVSNADVNDNLLELLRNAYAAGAYDTHSAWVSERGQSEPDFGEAADDYARSKVDTILIRAILKAMLSPSDEAVDALAKKMFPFSWDVCGEYAREGFRDNTRSTITTYINHYLGEEQ